MAFTVTRIAVAGVSISVLEGITPAGGYAGGGRMRVRNSGPSTAWLGPTGVTVATGFPLPSGAELDLSDLSLDADDDLFAICTAVSTVRTLTAATAAALIATFTTSVAHGFAVGQSVVVAGVTPAGYNGTWVIDSVPSTTTFTANIGTTPTAGTVFGTATSDVAEAAALAVLNVT